MSKKKKIIKKKVKKDTELFNFYTIKPFNAPIIFYYADKLTGITKHLNKNKEIGKWLSERIPEMEFEDEGKIEGFVKSNNESRPCIIFIKIPKEKNWYFYGTLMHEVVHLVDFLEQYFNFRDEMEFRAWLTESIFTDLRLLINNEKRK